jgi:medium-chain acyl-[acyl-carrier-protein] hydrolase
VILRIAVEVFNSGRPSLNQELWMSTVTQILSHDMLQRWLPYCRMEPGRPRVRLLCFAHAGGSALNFRSWPDKFPWNVQVCAVQLPGRERRLREPFIRHMPELIDRMSEVLLPWIDGPVALLGHSLGAKVAFEFARRLCSHGGAQKIVHLFVSGCPAPHLRSGRDPIYNLPDNKFMERLAEFDGTPRQVLEDPQLMQFLAPRLRADFELDDTYTFEQDIPLQCPITAWAGDADDLVSADSLEGWRQHTRGEFSSRILKGGHFAFYEQEAEILPQIRKALSRTNSS